MRPDAGTSGSSDMYVRQRLSMISVSNISHTCKRFEGTWGLACSEMVVVLSHGEQPLARDISAAQDIFEEGDNVLPLLGAAERDQQ